MFGLAKPGGVKNRSLWTGGIWVGKDDRDMDVITSKDGIFTSRSVRRTQPAWRARETLQLQGSPWTKKAPRLGRTAHAAPLPRIMEEPGREKEGGENEPEPAGDEAGSDVESSKHDTISDLLLSSGQPTPRSSSTDSNQGGGQKRETEGEGREEPAKASKTADAEEPPTKQQKTAESSPTSADPGSPKGSLFPPLYAGQVEEQEDETGYHEDDLWEERVWKECEEEYEADSEGEEEDEDRPPKVSEEELERLDAEAGKAELDKLANMKVVKTIKKEECSEEGKFLTLRTVFDWRKRDGVWKRRCRIVCREFRAGAQSTEETFSPTSGHAAVRMMFLFHLIYNWELTVLDIRDAFLQVKQKALMYADISPWIRTLLGLDEDHVWKVEKCLPGQRSAAEQWFTHLVEILKRLGFEQFVGIPSILKHRVKKIAVSIHVDDELVAGAKGEGRWLICELEKFFKLTVEGPFPSHRGSGEQLHYLKRTYEFLEEGILVTVSKKHYEKLKGLYKLGNRKPRQTPEHQLIGTVDNSKELEENECKKFRSALGTLLYISQDRWDLQHVTKCLASKMSKPTEQALTCLKQALLYVQGTEQLGFLLKYTKVGNKMLDAIYQREEQEEEDEEKKGTHSMEVFTDADWASDREVRWSTSSVIVCVNAVPVLSYSRTQKATALSSAESEVLACSGGASEAMLLKKLWMFLAGKLLVEIRMDSSAGRQWMMRTGVGGLKHIDLRVLWLQRGVKNNSFKAKPVPTKLNIADLNTKRLGVSRRRFLMYHIGAMVWNGESHERYGKEEAMEHVAGEVCRSQVRALRATLLNERGSKTARAMYLTMMVNMISQIAGQPDDFGGREREEREFVFIYVKEVSGWIILFSVLLGGIFA